MLQRWKGLKKRKQLQKSLGCHGPCADHQDHVKEGRLLGGAKSTGRPPSSGRTEEVVIRGIEPPHVRGNTAHQGSKHTTQQF